MPLIAGLKTPKWPNSVDPYQNKVLKHRILGVLVSGYRAGPPRARARRGLRARRVLPSTQRMHGSEQALYYSC